MENARSGSKLGLVEFMWGIMPFTSDQRHLAAQSMSGSILYIPMLKLYRPPADAQPGCKWAFPADVSSREVINVSNQGVLTITI